MDIRMWCRAAMGAAIVCGGRAAGAQEDCSDQVALGFSSTWVKSDVPFEGILGGETAAGELRVLGGEGEPGRVEVFANLVTRRSAGQPGVQGWSFGIAVEGEASITSATVDGTDDIC